MNTVKIHKQLSNNLFLVSSIKETIQGIKEDIYTIKLGKTTSCNCKYGIHTQADKFNISPCKHVALVQAVHKESKLKNLIHQGLVDKKLKVEKVLKIRHIKNNTYSVVYLLANGGKGCTFISIKNLEDKYFVAITSDLEPGRFECYINSKNIFIDKYKFGNQFIIELTPLGWLRKCNSRYGEMKSLPNFDLYEACTSPMFPVSKENCGAYVLDVLKTNTRMEEVQTVTKFYLKQCSKLPVSRKDVVDFKDYVVESLQISA